MERIDIMKIQKLLAILFVIAMLSGLAIFASAESHECVFDQIVWETEDDFVKYACACGETYVAHQGYTCSSTVLSVASCTRAGYTAHYCKVCDEFYYEIAPALGHTYVVTDSMDPICLEDGYITYTCEVCEDTYTDIVPATGHNIVAKNEEIIYPTCTEPGMEAYWYCGDCCVYFADAELTTLMEDQTGMKLEIPATGHNIVSKNETALEATCTEEGLVTYWYCGDCCIYFADAELTTLMEDQTGMNLAVPATGHNFVDGVCTKCGEKDPNYNPGTADAISMVVALMAVSGMAIVVTAKKKF